MQSWQSWRPKLQLHDRWAQGLGSKMGLLCVWVGFAPQM